MKNIDIDISTDSRKEVSHLLEKFLASEIVLNLKLRNYHWNVEANNFSELHSFFEGLYDSSSETIDEIAERTRMLGNQVQANHENFLQKTFLAGEKEINISSNTMVQNLLDDIECTIRNMRTAIIQVGELGDVGTEDFLTGLIQAHEKNAWMLRSML